MSRVWWLVPCFLLLGGCALGGKTLSPDLDTGLMVGYKSSVEVPIESSVEQSGPGNAGGVAGKIGGDGDSVALWLAILALGAYPIQRTARLAWNSWRGRSGPRSGKGRDVCVKLSEWDS